jgi:HEAT repeat protein
MAKEPRGGSQLQRYCPKCWAENRYEAQVCRQCGASLVEPDKDFASKLIDAIEHPEPTRAALAAEVLGNHLREPRAVPALMRRLARVTDSTDVAVGAATALGQIGDRQAIPLLVAVLDEVGRPLVVRLAAAEALAALGGGAARQALEQTARQPALPRVLQRLLADLLADEVP